MKFKLSQVGEQLVVEVRLSGKELVNQQELGYFAKRKLR